MTELLRLEGLEVSFPGAEGAIRVLRDVDLSVVGGEIVGLVGESGSGKTMTALAILGLLPPQGSITAGRVLFDGERVDALEPAALRRLRGGAIGLVFQEPAEALNPVFTVGQQIAEVVRAHHRSSRNEARRRALELLERVAMPAAADRMDSYPHQLSGGQRQRVMIALALAGEPRLLLADEPTSALDVTVQSQILDLLDRLRRELGLTVLLITHDLGVVAESCDRVAVMYSGEVVETAPVTALFERPLHPYSRALIAARPRLGGSDQDELTTIDGRIPEPARRPPGCAFHPRCPEALPVCRRSPPARVAPETSRSVRCFLHDHHGAERS